MIIHLVPPLLSLLYSVAVHIFLCSFHERSLFKIHHWNPIITRASHCIATLIICSILGSNPISPPLTQIAAVINTIVSIKLILQTRYVEINGPPPPFTTDLHDKVILITGANSGIGLETTRLLYKQYNATVILACRSKGRASEAMDNIDPSWKESGVKNSSSGIISYGDRMHFLPLDLTSIQSIHKAVKLFLEEMKMPLHILINNAGVMLNERMETGDGLEMTMAANHLGHFLLTNLLLPKLRETAINDKKATKVITVSSTLYSNAIRPRSNNDELSKRGNEPGIDLIDLQCRNKPYRLFEQYAQSKLANILFARELGKREKLLHDGLVQSDVLHPGLVRTNVTRNMPWFLYYPNLIFSLFMVMLQKSPVCGAYTTVYCAVRDEEENDDSCYFVNSKEQPLDELALRDDEGRKLWKLSCQLMALPLEKEN